MSRLSNIPQSPLLIGEAHIIYTQKLPASVALWQRHTEGQAFEKLWALAWRFRANKGPLVLARQDSTISVLHWGDRLSGSRVYFKHAVYRKVTHELVKPHVGGIANHEAASAAPLIPTILSSSDLA